MNKERKCIVTGKRTKINKHQVSLSPEGHDFLRKRSYLMTKEFNEKLKNRIFNSEEMKDRSAEFQNEAYNEIFLGGNFTDESILHMVINVLSGKGANGMTSNIIYNLILKYIPELKSHLEEVDHE